MGGSQISSGSSGKGIKKISTRSSLLFYALFYSMAIVRVSYRLICASVNLSPFNGHDWFSRRAIAEINNELVRFWKSAIVWFIFPGSSVVVSVLFSGIIAGGISISTEYAIVTNMAIMMTRLEEGTI